MPKQKAPLAVRLSPDVDERLTACADRVKTSKHNLLVMGAEAVVEAIEEHKGKLVVPIEFEVKCVPVEKGSK